MKNIATGARFCTLFYFALCQETTIPSQQTTCSPEATTQTMSEEDTTPPSGMNTTTEPTNNSTRCTPETLCSSYNGTLTQNGCYYFCRGSNNFSTVFSGFLQNGDPCRFAFRNDTGVCRNNSCLFNMG